jgi:hypothetical protein
MPRRQDTTSRPKHHETRKQSAMNFQDVQVDLHEQKESFTRLSDVCSGQPGSIPLAGPMDSVCRVTSPLVRSSTLAQDENEPMGALPTNTDLLEILKPSQVVHDESKESIESLMAAFSIEVGACFRPLLERVPIEGHSNCRKPQSSIPIGKAKIKYAKHSRKRHVIGSPEQYRSMLAHPGKYSEARHRQRDSYFIRLPMDVEAFAF